MRALVLLATALSFAAPALAQQKADFIDGTYAFAPGACKKLKALAAGGVRAVMTVPWHVTADGIGFWEGGCRFSKITKGERMSEWHVVAACENAGDEYVERYTFRRVKRGQFNVTLTTPGISDEQAKPVRYTRCDVGKIPDPQ